LVAPPYWPVAPIRNASRLVSLDADAVVERLIGEVPGLRAVVGYRGGRYQPLYVSDATVEKYGGAAAVDDDAARFHRSLYPDLREEDLYRDLLVDVGGLRAFVLRFEGLTVLRYTDGDEGLYVALDVETAAPPVLDAVEATV